MIVPWPISERAMRITAVSFGWMTTQALTSGEPSCARTTLVPNGNSNPSAKPPVTAAELTMKERRFISLVSLLRLSLAASWIAARTSWNVPRRQMLVTAVSISVVGRLRLLREQRRGGHDHAGLAVAALRYLELDQAFCTVCEPSVARPSIMMIFCSAAKRSSASSRSAWPRR